MGIEETWRGWGAGGVRAVNKERNSVACQVGPRTDGIGVLDKC
jgi:hypothetical protein